MVWLFLIFAFSLPMASSDQQCEYGVSAAKESAKAVSNLAVQLYQQIARPDQNTIFSPVSIALALALVESASDGTTKSEIQAVLRPLNSNQSEPSQLYQSLQHQLQIKGEKSRLSIANGLFYSDDFHLKQDYVDTLQKCFETQIGKEPFAQQPEEARRRINEWISNATAQKIPELFKSGSIDASTVAVLANAIYMKAAWEHQFSRTEDLPFYRSGKSDQAQNVSFMIQKEDFGYISTDKYDAVELPYDGAPLSMYIILPKQRDGIQALEQSLKGDDLVSLFGQTESKEVALKLPKFTIRQSVDLQPVLEKLGLKQMFSDQANFSRFAAEPVKISKAVHEAYIKVNENGTEAAAATGFSIIPLSLPLNKPPPVSFIADHPFIYVIVHKPTSAIAFMGKVNSVEAEEK